MADTVRSLQKQVRELNQALMCAHAQHRTECDRANILSRECSWLRQSHDKLTEAILAGAKEAIFPRRPMS